ncbi:MAG: YbjQ family protein [Nanoarchaeota archaeon]
MLSTTTFEFPGKKIKKILGVVKGNTVRSRWIGSNIMAGLRTLVGGEIPEYSELLIHAREEAQKRMEDEAEKIGADAVVNVRFTISEVMQSVIEILAYGTAVKF